MFVRRIGYRAERGRFNAEEGEIFDRKMFRNTGPTGAE